MDNTILLKVGIRQPIISFCMFCIQQYWSFWNPCFSYYMLYLWLYRHSIVLLWAHVSPQSLDYPICKTKYCWRSVEAHFQNGAGSVSLLFLALKAAITSFLDDSKQLPVRLPRLNTKNCWHSVDAHLMYGAGSVSLIILTGKVANTSSMNDCNQSPLRLCKMHSQKSFTLHWRSFPEWGSDHVINSFPEKGCHYFGYG